MSTAVGNGHQALLVGNGHQAMLVGKGHHLKKPELGMIITLRSSNWSSDSLPTERAEVSHAYGAGYSW